MPDERPEDKELKPQGEIFKGSRGYSAEGDISSLAPPPDDDGIGATPAASSESPANDQTDQPPPPQSNEEGSSQAPVLAPIGLAALVVLIALLVDDRYSLLVAAGGIALAYALGAWSVRETA